MPKNKLQQYFPLIRSKQEILEQIHSSPGLLNIYQQWRVEQQEEFLNFCSGAKGVKILYDSFAKAVLNPELFPERLNDLLSLLLGMEVTILEVLPTDNSRITDESSLVIMDILVRLKDGSIVNVEVQRVGYHFPGQRSACYSADLLLRQYIRVRKQKKDTFSYQDIKSVYTIVLFERSTKEFHDFPDQYIHKFEQVSDTGLKIGLLQKYVFIPLDIFLKKIQNNPVSSRLDAWLLFFSSDNPDDIISVITCCPEFKAMYDQIYGICRNLEEVMGMFSEELKILDRNTVTYMIDEMHDELKNAKIMLMQKDESLKQMDESLKQMDESLKQKDKSLEQKNEELKRMSTLNTENKIQIELAHQKIAELEKALRQLQSSEK